MVQENELEKTSLELAIVGLKKQIASDLKLKVLDIEGFGLKPSEYEGFSVLMVATSKSLHHCMINECGHRLTAWKKVEEYKNDKVVKGA